MLSGFAGIFQSDGEQAPAGVVERPGLLWERIHAI